MRTRAAVLYEVGLPAPYGESRPLSVQEVHLDGPGQGEVLVEIASAGLCHSDLAVIDGTRPRTLPIILGHEAAGIVREVGSGVHDVEVDDHVVFALTPMCGHCSYCLEGRPNLCQNGARANADGSLLNGKRHFRDLDGRELHYQLGVSAFSHHTVVAQESLVKIDPSIPLEKAALFGCAVQTGVGAVLNTAQVKPGTSVAVFGLGGVGLSVIMGARLAGAWPLVAVDLLDHKLELAHRLGASHGVNATDEDPVQAVMDLTQGGAHYAFEAVGNELVLEQAYRATRRGGTTVTIGAPSPDRLFTVPAIDLVVGERTLKGSYTGSAVPRRDIPRFLALYQAGLLPLDHLITGSITLEQINQGFDDLASAKAVRQLVRFTD